MFWDLRYIVSYDATHTLLLVLIIVILYYARRQQNIQYRLI